MPGERIGAFAASARVPRGRGDVADRGKRADAQGLTGNGLRGLRVLRGVFWGGLAEHPDWFGHPRVKLCEPGSAFITISETAKLTRWPLV